MAIWKSSSMHKLAASSHPKDKAIFDFAQRNGIRSLSFKDYKYLYCLLAVDDISLAIGGKRMPDRESSMKLWLAIARAESKIEQSKKMVVIDGLSKEDFAAVKPLLEGELAVRNLSALVPIRIGLGKAISNMLSGCVGDRNNLPFWEKISISMVLLDNLADFIKDRVNRILPRIDIAGVFRLIGALASNSLAVFWKLGVYRSIKFLAVPSALVIKGGFENEEKKEKQHGLSPRNIP